MPTRITLAASPDTEVRIKDFERDMDRVYKVVPLVRSKKRTLRALHAELDELRAKPDAEIDDEDAHEDAVLSKLCEILDVACKPVKDDQPCAGEVLLEAWREDKVTDEQIGTILAQVYEGTEDPT